MVGYGVTESDMTEQLSVRVHTHTYIHTYIQTGTENFE